MVALSATVIESNSRALTHRENDIKNILAYLDAHENIILRSYNVTILFILRTNNAVKEKKQTL